MKLIALSILALTTVAHAAVIRGAGASFPAPLYMKWCDAYGKNNKGTQVDYQSMGSGNGVSNFLKGTVQFGASDAPLNKEQETQATAKGIVPLHIPTVMGAVVLTYNLPGLKELKLDGATIADIYQGKITKWNDPRLVAANPELAKRDQPIMAVYRSDGSGTTAIFTDYLSKVSADWKEKVGSGTSIKWLVGQGAKGNESVAQTVSSTPGAFAYVELIYAISQNLPYAKVKNKAGTFVEANMTTVTNAATGMLPELKEDIRKSITNASGKMAYPISGITYLIVAQKQAKALGEDLKKFLTWALTDGQKIAPSMHYAPLPKSLVENAKNTINSLQMN